MLRWGFFFALYVQGLLAQSGFYGGRGVDTVLTQHTLDSVQAASKVDHPSSKPRRAPDQAHIAIFLPFNLDGLYAPGSFALRDSALYTYNANAWDFYLGSKIALDSLLRNPVFKWRRPHLFFHYHDTKDLTKVESTFVKSLVSW